jgi:hypothetical protein
VEEILVEQCGIHPSAVGRDHIHPPLKNFPDVNANDAMRPPFCNISTMSQKKRVARFV